MLKVQVSPRPAAAVEAAPPASSPPTKAQAYAPGRVDVFFLGITLVISGQYFSWNLGLAAGLYSYLVIYVAMGLAYAAFCCCMAEVTSALPFAGGAFGLARCTLGFFPAYVIGCCETVEYIASVAVIVLALADLLALVAPALGECKPLVWLAFYASSLALQVRGHGAFWRTSLVVGALSLAILLLYCLGLLGHVDLEANTLRQEPPQLYVGGVRGAMAVLPYAAWFFLGIEALNLASDDMPQPKTQIPVAQVACIATLFATGLFTLLVTVALPTAGGIGAIAGALAPLNNGFIALLHVDVTIATLLTLLSQYAAAYGLSWAHSKLIHGMAQSKLLPPWLAATTARYQTPYAATIVGAVLGYAICLAVYLEPAIGSYLLPLCLLFAFTSYAGQCLGYISLRSHYPLVREARFRNPFGLVGAVYALVVWVVSIVAIFGFQPGPEITLGLFAATLVVLTLYYVLVAKKRQVMSEDESRVLLKAHILKFNASRRRSTGTFHRSRVTSSSLAVVRGTSSSNAAFRVASWVKGNAPSSST